MTDTLGPVPKRQSKADSTMRGVGRADFDAVLALMSAELVVHLHQQGYPADGAERLKNCLLVNVQGGKLNRCWTVLDTAVALDGVSLTGTQTTDLMILGWLTEIVNAVYLIWDDIIDRSTTRRGMPCWYLQPEVGLIAINDASFLRSTVFVFLEKHFSQHPAYSELSRIFHESFLQTDLGQAYEMFLGTKSQGIHSFSLEKYWIIADCKTSYYTTYMPLALPIVYLCLGTPQNLHHVHRFGFHMGKYYQARNDYLDVFGNPNDTGKIGSDVKENKCTWLIVQALQRCNTTQRRTLESCYGSQDDDDVAKVVGVFRELDLITAFQQWEQEYLQSAREIIDSVDESQGLSKGALTVFLSKLDGDKLRNIGVPVTNGVLTSSHPDRAEDELGEIRHGLLYHV